MITNRGIDGMVVVVMVMGCAAGTGDGGEGGIGWWY